ncbi:MAG TPA: hypothetical protein VLG10_00975, partial [Methylomirabilota bacterium]|nr:hypothetical protein [Methylomirabilota bacterium]
LEFLDRPHDLADGFLDPGAEPGRIADRAAAAFVPDVEVRQMLLETLDVGERLARVARALEDVLDALRRRGDSA